ncbi:hypothetical protein B0H16DRAFT_1749308 [Mycena metata]|uniref:Uncharacterized protein n=1 Tax=Mycena metata TaxID=1033252 RepID=A0AAD7DU03_9AGAR|nr:hypothetical protein B0H16DRAFT_1749308 [Mycena metata]
MPSSNVEAADGTWLTYSWPANFRFPAALDIPADDEMVEQFETVPRSANGLSDWAYVGKNHAERDHTRGLLLLYKRPPALPFTGARRALCPVGIRVQGFIERLNLGPLGTLTSGKTPQAALQFVVLNGGRTSGHIFRQYKAAVDGVVRYIYQSLGETPPAARSEDDETLFVARRVFTKVVAGNRNSPSALHEGDDPRELCRAFETEWRVLAKAKIGEYVPHADDPTRGSKHPCDAMSIREGDFVDVCIGFDIVSRRDRAGENHLQVHLSIEHVLLLVSALEDAALDGDAGAEDVVHGPGADF